MDVSEPRSGRDTRLLGLVIVIAVAVLFVLARFRFPAVDAPTTPVVPGPLDRLAAGVAYGDLAAAVLVSLQRVEPALMSIELEDAAGARRGALGVRLRADAVFVRVPPGSQIVVAPDGSVPVVRSVDLRREVGVLLPTAGAGQSARAANTFSGFAYVAVVEPAGGGSTATPVFIGRVTAIDDEGWGSVLLPGGRPYLPAGALVFQLDGQFVGLAIAMPDGAPAIVPGARLEALLALPGGLDGATR